MVARGAQGNPWLFAQIAHLRATGKQLPPPTPRERVETALEHARQLIAQKGGHAIVEMRKHVAWYLSGMQGAAAVRNAVNGCTSYDALYDLLMRFTREQESLKQGHNVRKPRISGIKGQLTLTGTSTFNIIDLLIFRHYEKPSRLD